MSETNGGRRLGEQKTLGAQIESDLARARKALNAERFDQVLAAAERALARSREAQIFSYFPEIDRLQDASHEGSQVAAHIDQLLGQVHDLEPIGASQDALAMLKDALNGLALAGSPTLARKSPLVGTPGGKPNLSPLKSMMCAGFLKRRTSVKPTDWLKSSYTNIPATVRYCSGKIA